MAPRAVLMKTGLKSVNTARPVNTVRSVNTGRPFSTARSFNTVRPSYTAHPKSTIHCARPRTYFQNQAQSTVHRPFYKRTALTNRCFNQRFNTGRPFRSTVNTVRARGFNAVKPSTCWVWRPIKPNGASLSNSQLNDKGFVDSGCSRHMTGNITHLSDFKDFDGGYVTFGGGAYGGRITGKGTIKTDNLDFDDVYFVKELKFNLFSVSQMCDKKNYVLFTDSECLVLSPNFKLPDENQILLKIPRQDNMYSFDMKNIVPKDSLTCLVAKATSEESMLWHRRLGHINFKNINKLVKENLVRDLPLKRFENDQTCVACLKGKQHRASCKTKAFNPITKPLFMLHMDLFGPTFVSSLMHKKYCLVVTDDYSRFSWVFFLTTKDETSEILKNFIKEVENLVDKKVKIIRSDNGTEFKNKVMDDFCREKGIKREYSVARTPQQNGVAERKNRTLIEAARTMLADSKLPTTFWAEAVSTACYVQNRVLIVKPHNKTPYELFRGFKPAIDLILDAPINQDQNGTHDELQIFRIMGNVKSTKKKQKRVLKLFSDPAWRLLVHKWDPDRKTWKDERRDSVIKNKAILIYQMDVKSTFLYGKIEEEVYVCQPLGFEDPDYPDKVYKVVKAYKWTSYKAPKAWFQDSPLELVAYTDSVYAGDSHLIGSQPLEVVSFLGNRLDFLVSLIITKEVRLIYIGDGVSLTVYPKHRRIYTRLLKLADQRAHTPTSEKLEARVKIGKTRRQARVVLSDDEDIADYSSKQGRKLSNVEVQEKAILKRTTIQANCEVSKTAGGRRKGTATEEVPIVLSLTGSESDLRKKSKKEREQERLSFAEAIRLEEQIMRKQRAQIANDSKKFYLQTVHQKKGAKSYGSESAKSPENNKSPENMKTAEKMRKKMMVANSEGNRKKYPKETGAKRK
ncbi:putative ribonuclease H-like domain-containing protein [Tanacetum coccineum]